MISLEPQMEQLHWTRRLCIYGADEDDSLCPDLVPSGVKVNRVAGDHHFDEDYPGIAALILKERSIPATDTGPAP